MATSTGRRLTADEFFALPGELKHTELIDGEVVVDTPSTRHQDLVLWLAARLLWFAEAHPELGRPGIELSTPIDQDNVFAPDVWWTLPDHAPLADQNRHRHAPDLVIEVRSPSTWHHDRGRKRDGYAAIGVQELWLVDGHADEITVWRRSGPDADGFDVTFTVAEGESLTTPVVPGFEVDLAALFAPR